MGTGDTSPSRGGREVLAAASLGRSDRAETQKDERWVPCQGARTTVTDRYVMIRNLSGVLAEETLGCQASFICFITNYTHMRHSFALLQITHGHTYTLRSFCSVHTRAHPVS